MSDTNTAKKADKPDQAAQDNKANQPGGFLGFIEKVGNKLPDPFWLFVILGVLVLISSFIFNKLGLSATNPENGEPVEIVNLLSLSLIHI